MNTTIDQRLTDYDPDVQETLSSLRTLVHEVAKQTDGCGTIVEDLKWNQISFLTVRPKSGTTLRIDQNKTNGVSMYVNCQSNLIDQIADQYPTEFDYAGTREIALKSPIKDCIAALKHVIAMVLLYHQNK